MSDNPLRPQIFESLNLKETDELLEIWQNNNRNEWSDLAFEVIEQILDERGVEIPTQDEPPSEEESDVESDASSADLPTFYKPEQVLTFISAASNTAWVILAVYFIYGLWYFFSGLGTYLDARELTDAVISLFSRVVTGIITFVILKGVSYGLNVLMEFEFNTRSKNSNKHSS